MPLAHRVFGARAILRDTRLSLAKSLCFSRLLSGTDTWLEAPRAAVQPIHAARLRVLRQVTGTCRYTDTGHGTDEHTLSVLGELPTDLLLLQKRLAGLPSLLSSRAPRVLLALRCQKGTHAAHCLAEDLLWC